MTYAFDFASVLSSWPQFLEGAWMTILLSFPATVIGPIVVPLIIFHQLQLMICAWIARRLGARPDAVTVPAT